MEGGLKQDLQNMFQIEIQYNTKGAPMNCFTKSWTPYHIFLEKQTKPSSMDFQPACISLCVGFRFMGVGVKIASTESFFFLSSKRFFSSTDVKIRKQATRKRFSWIFFVLHFTQLHFTQLHFTQLHFTKQHFTKLHFAKLHVTKLYFTKLHFRKLHFTKFNFRKLHFTSYVLQTMYILQSSFYKTLFYSF